LCCDLKNTDISSNVVTKRIILSTAHKIFDPIGFTAPVTLFPKILLQETWELKLGWDSQVPEDLAQKFFKWREQLPLLSGVKIPRCLLAENFNHDNMTLHVFSDASKCAYGAVVYLRVVTDGCASIQLVQAKFHVAPVKPVTIPRLELIGCCIGARLAKSVKDSLNLMQIPTYYWTDSMTALSWIQRDEQW